MSSRFSNGDNELKAYIEYLNELSVVKSLEPLELSCTKCSAVLVTGSYVVIAKTDEAEYLLGYFSTSPCCGLEIFTPCITSDEGSAIALAYEVQRHGTLHRSRRIAVIPYEIHHSKVQ